MIEVDERFCLLYKICEAEDMATKGMMTSNTSEPKVNLLNMNNSQRQDQILKLFNQVSSLERSQAILPSGKCPHSAPPPTESPAALNKLCSGRKKKRLVGYL